MVFIASATQQPSSTREGSCKTPYGRSVDGRRCQQAEGGEGRACYTVWYVTQRLHSRHTLTILPVWKYVEAMKDAPQLLDLLASDAEEIEPTRAAGGKQFLYDEVRAL